MRHRLCIIALSGLLLIAGFLAGPYAGLIGQSEATSSTPCDSSDLLGVEEGSQIDQVERTQFSPAMHKNMENAGNAQTTGIRDNNDLSKENRTAAQRDMGSRPGSPLADAIQVNSVGELAAPVPTELIRRQVPVAGQE